MYIVIFLLFYIKCHYKVKLTLINILHIWHSRSRYCFYDLWRSFGGICENKDNKLCIKLFLYCIVCVLLHFPIQTHLTKVLQPFPFLLMKPSWTSLPPLKKKGFCAQLRTLALHYISKKFFTNKRNKAYNPKNGTFQILLPLTFLYRFKKIQLFCMMII